MRKPIAITTACGFSPECGTMSVTIALCDDGTMWAWERGAWVPFAPIPTGLQVEYPLLQEVKP